MGQQRWNGDKCGSKEPALKAIGSFLLVCFLLLNAAAEMVAVPKGKFTTFFKGEGTDTIQIPSFFLDKYAVTNIQFNDFLKSHEHYRKSKVGRLFADVFYLKHWKADLLKKIEVKDFGEKPVTNVSWFVARKYCESLGKRLPTISEWEYASDGQSPLNEKIILEWYGKTNEKESLKPVKKGAVNKFGLAGMHGQAWELVEDFLTVMISSDSRSKGDRTDGFFCGGGSLTSRDASKYATFMRYAQRSSLRGNYSGQNLGFRCAKSMEEE